MISGATLQKLLESLVFELRHVCQSCDREGLFRCRLFSDRASAAGPLNAWIMPLSPAQGRLEELSNSPLQLAPEEVGNRKEDAANADDCCELRQDERCVRASRDGEGQSEGQSEAWLEGNLDQEVTMPRA